MKRTEMKKQSILIEIEEDDDFLSQVTLAEAEANKRRKITTIDSDQNHEKKKKAEEEEEGAYTAALRGSKSLTWQRLKKAMASAPNHNLIQSNGGVRAGDFGGSEPLIADKICPCGLGSCIVYVAYTEKNRGRSFYKCPFREENGGCGFFQWCDGASAAVKNENQHNYVSNSVLFPDLQCPCGAGSCLILTAKTGKNVGQQFYKCPAMQGSSCGFFKWCNDNTVAVGLPSPVGASKVYSNMNDSSDTSYVLKTGSACFKCGKEGHWAKDCTISSSASPAEIGGKSASSGSCYKCGQPGHWANDCSISSSVSHAEIGGRSASSGSCYKCGQPGHWARDCMSRQYKKLTKY